MPIWDDTKEAMKGMDAEFRRDKGLPTQEDEAIRTAAEKEIKIRENRVVEEKFSKAVKVAADKMKGPSAKEAERTDPWIPVPEGLMPNEEDCF